MAQAVFEGVSKRFGDVLALRDFSLSVDAGELLTVLGPSGCGKSTLLRLTAGLEALTSGAIIVDGRRIDALPARQRNVAMVFQNYALYPHMTVRANIEFPLRMRGVRRAERARQAEDMAALLEIGGFLDRRPAELSGGQRQRVALARALVRRPALFLLDEPLSNLDARLRASVREYIREIQRRLGVTMLYVTHDQAEAMALGDRIVVMHDGRMQQVGSPVAVYEQPENTFVAGFIGTPPMNLLPADYADGRLCVAGQYVTLPAGVRTCLGSAACRLTVGVRPEAFVTAPADGLAATIDTASRELLGSETVVRATVGSLPVKVRLFGMARDLPATVVAPPDALHLFAADSGGRIAPNL